MRQLYVIEARNPDGSLNFEDPQPYDIFGIQAINGISEDHMAKVIFRRLGDSIILSGDSVIAWPKLIDPRFQARRKTW